MSKKIPIIYKKERVVLSELLPYEIPLIFSNRFFYDFLIENDLEYVSGNFRWKYKNDVTDEAIKLLLGFQKCNLGKISLNDFHVIKNIENIKDEEKGSIPFVYTIKHKDDEYRELAIIHPRKQIMAVNFYDQFKEKIIYHSKKSKFSLRCPEKVAKTIYWNDKSKIQNFNDDDDFIEEHDREYKSIKSFFSYRKYSYIHKFYESDEYHRCEKQYNKMLKLDVSKCFDSLYTHSIAWALIGKETIKANLDRKAGTFADHFDTLMQKKNYNETNGILIGSELSRIFAELILQDIDNKLLLKLKSDNILFKKDYEIFRYVDDYFVFFNDEGVQSSIVKNLYFCLREYKLSLNSGKMILYEKPIITELSIAKVKIKKLFTKKIKYEIVSEPNESKESEVKRGKVSLDIKSLITDFKAIIKTCNIEYKDVMIYSFGILESKVKKIIKDYLSIEKNSTVNKNFVDSISSILEFCFFIYTVSPRVSSTIKLIRIVKQITVFLKKNHLNRDMSHLIYKTIFDNVYFVLNKNGLENNVQVETLYLMLIISDLGRYYWLDDSVLSSYFSTKDLNYFAITTSLFYMRNKVRYNSLRCEVVNIIKEKFRSASGNISKSTELTLLFFDTMSCPYISEHDKKEIMSLCEIDASKQTELMNLRAVWFIKWTNFDLGKELDAKRSLEVY
jgi:hypothetical protein